MFEQFFLNPAALTVGGALISSPIIIHLINRMRFKRQRWAAMEFLLKSQKRNRRRLIIEQLLLLFLRCLIIALTGLLLARFSGFSFGSFEQKSNQHVILLDDTLSMLDKGKGKDNCFKAAQQEIVEVIARSVSQSSTDDSIVILRLSDLFRGAKHEPKVYRRLNDASVLTAMESDVAAMECSNLSLSLLTGLQKDRASGGAAQAGEADAAPALGGLQKVLDMVKNSPDKVTVHILSDFRKKDWTGADAKDLHKAMLDLGALENVKYIYLVDTAHPTRGANQGGVPVYNDNLGIAEVRPNTRVASDGSTVFVTTTVVNNSPRDADVHVVPFDTADGQERSEKNYETPMPLKVPAGKTAQAVFSLPIRAEIKEDGKGFARIGVRLLNAARLPLEDGLAEDDVRHAVIEVRKTIPVLVIDGNGPESRRNGDSYYVSSALGAIRDSKYEVVFGEQLSGGDPREALESPELANFTSILFINVSRLQNEKQRTSLEQFVRQGGGVCFFMGPDVNAPYYNDELYRKGFGVFPVPIESTFQPMAGEKLKPAEYTGRHQILLRDDVFPKIDKLPVFGPVFKNAGQREWLKHLAVPRYWPARPVNEWGGELGQIREVANLPNDDTAGKYERDIRELVKKLPVDREEYREYRPALKRYEGSFTFALRDAAKVPAFRLAEMIEAMLTDRGKEVDRAEYPNLTEFWDLRDAAIQELKQEAVHLRKRLLYSSPVVVVKDVGRGRVVAWMTTAGKEWNSWAAGSTASPLYPSLIYELQNYLTGTSGDAGELVGSAITLSADPKRFDQSKVLKIVRRYHKPVAGAPESVLPPSVFHGTPDKGVIRFALDPALWPGFYDARLMFADSPETAPPLTSWGQVFNVDARSEGDLQRVSQEEMESSFLRQAQTRNNIGWRQMGESGTDLINKAWELSEWPVFFLVMIVILVCEQALAVHLSFHLRTQEAEMPAQVTNPRVRAA
jgi:hypothetical protein